MLIEITAESLFIRLNSAPFTLYCICGSLYDSQTTKKPRNYPSSGPTKNGALLTPPLIGPCERTAASVIKKGRKWRPCPKG